MITANPHKTVQMAFVSAEEPQPKCYFEFSGLSSDTKPTTFDGASVANGSTFLVMDTSDVYIFDETNSVWRKL